MDTHDGARGIVRERQHQQLGVGGDCRLQIGSLQAEVILVFGVDDNRRAARHHAQRLIAHERGLRNDHLVALFNQRAEREVDRLTAAHGDKRLLRGAVCKRKTPFVVVGDLPEQIGKAAVRRVPGSALFQTADTLVADMPRGLEIGLADAQRNHMIHLVGDIKEFADTRRTDRTDTAVQVFIVIYHRIRLLSSCSSSKSARFMPLSL